MLNDILSIFWGLFQSSISYLMSFNILGFPIRYLIISSFILGVIIDAIILKP